MAYKCYRYIGETFGGAQALQYNDVFIYVVKGIFDKVCTDFDDIVPVSEWIDLDEFVDAGGYTHRGCKKYFYIDSSDCRFALVFKEWIKPDGYYTYYQYNVTIQATNLTNDSEYAEGWEIVPTQFAFYFDPDFDPEYNSHYWYPRSDAWIITVITDDNNRVVSISAPQYWLESDYDGHSPCNMFMIDKENKFAIPGCNLKSSLSGSVFPYGSGKWLANYTPDYDIIGRVLYQYERLPIAGYMEQGKAIKAIPIYNDMFNNTFALSRLTNHEMSVFMNYEWEQLNGECYDGAAITVDGQLWQPIGTSLYIPVSYKEDILEYINLPTP